MRIKSANILARARDEYWEIICCALYPKKHRWLVFQQTPQTWKVLTRNFEPLKHCRYSHDHLLLGQETADTGPLSVAKRLPRVRRQSLESAVHHAFRTELGSIFTVNSRVMVHARQIDTNVHVLGDLVLAANDCVFLGVVLCLGDGAEEAKGFAVWIVSKYVHFGLQACVEPLLTKCWLSRI